MTSIRPRAGSPLRTRHPILWPGLALTAIILAATALRLWHLHTLPPALYYDPAMNGSDIRMLSSGAGLPVYFPANTGREPLFIYLQALAVAALGPTPFALYFVSALIGILTIPAIYFLAHSLWSPAGEAAGPFAATSRRDVAWLALLASAALAVSYWHLSLSRRGMRTIMLPLVSALAIGFFWRAWTRQRHRDYVCAGVLLAIGLYTYTAARLLPGVLLVFVGVELAVDLWGARRKGRAGLWDLWPAWRGRLAGLALLAGVALAVLLPLAIAAWQHPGLLSTRIDQISILSAPRGPGQAGLVRRLAGSLLATIRLFYDAGDVNARSNLPGRPANDPFMAVLFTLGILWSLLRVRDARYRLLLIWLGIMLVPVALSTDAPNFVRGSGALPPLVLLCSAGAIAVLAFLPFRPVSRYGLPLILLALLLVSGGLTARDYFLRWPSAPRFGDAFVQVPGTAPETAAEMIARLLPGSSADHPLLISYAQYIMPHTVFAAGASQTAQPSPRVLADIRDAGVRFVLEDSFDPQEPLVLLWQEGGITRSATLDPLLPADAKEVRSLFNTSAVERVRAPGYQTDGPVIFTGSVPAGVRLGSRKIAYPMDVKFEGGARLLGYNVEPAHAVGSASPGDDRPSEVTLALFWELTGSARSLEMVDSTVFVHLVDSQGNLHQANAIPRQAYLFGWLRAGQKILVEDRHAFPVTADFAPGKAHFEVGLLRPGAGEGAGSDKRFAIVDGEGRVAGNQVDLGATMIGGPPPQASVAGLNPLGAQFDNRIELVGWSAGPDPSGSGNLRVDLAWRALDRSTTDYTAFVHLVDSAERIVAQHDQPPGAPEDPTTRWVPGEVLRSTFLLQPPPGTAYEGLKLRVGLYEPVSGRQLPVTQAPDQVSATFATYLMLPLQP